MTWKHAILPTFYLSVSVVIIALASIIIETILNENNTDGSVWLFGGVILAFACLGAVVAIQAIVVGFLEPETEAEDVTPPNLAKANVRSIVTLLTI